MAILLPQPCKAKPFCPPLPFFFYSVSTLSLPSALDTLASTGLRHTSHTSFLGPLPSCAWNRFPRYIYRASHPHPASAELLWQTHVPSPLVYHSCFHVALWLIVQFAIIFCLNLSIKIMSAPLGRMPFPVQSLGGPDRESRCAVTMFSLKVSIPWVTLGAS